MSDQPSNPYDAVPYPAMPVAQAHPGRLAAIARLFGLDSPLASGARVLEIGCADGSNLLPLADALPGARFLGIDSSAVQIAAGQKMLAAARLKNVELRAQDILDFPVTEGKFDYILVHGVYSWVAEPVREKIMAVCAQHLSENGVAYVSYNALPGWNMRRSLREMMRYHTAALREPQTKVAQARALVKFLADSVPSENNAYGTLLKGELDLIARVPDHYLFHDYLSEENTAFYFHEFVAHASKHRLQFLGETSVASMVATNFPEPISKTLGQIGNISAQEQYMDFLRNRAFRQTLLCHAKAPLRRKLTVDRLKGLAVQPLFAPVAAPVDLKAGVQISFATLGGQQITTADPFLKAVFAVFSESNARAIGFSELLAEASGRANPHVAASANRAQLEEATLVTNLMNLATKAHVELYAEPLGIALSIPEKPTVSALVRTQAAQGRAMTNRVHMPIPADLFGRAVVQLCDGTRTRDEIVTAVVQLVKKDLLNVQEDGKPVTDEKRLGELLAPQVENLLRSLARNGFFAR